MTNANRITYQNGLFRLIEMTYSSLSKRPINKKPENKIETIRK